MDESNGVSPELDPAVIGADTLVADENTPVSAEDGHVAQDDDAQVASDTAVTPPTQTQTDAEKEAQRIKREEGKLQQTQRLLEEERRKNEEERKKSQAYAEWITAKPERLAEAYIEQGYTPAQAQAEVARLQAQGYWNQPRTVAGQPYTQQTVDPYQAAQQVILMDRFFSEAPELDFRGKSREEAEDARYAYQQIADVAAGLLAGRVPGVTDEMSALRKAREIVSGKETKTKPVTEDERIQSLATSAGNRAGVMPTPSGGAPTRKSVNLTPEQKTAARANGMSDEEYAKYI